MTDQLSELPWEELRRTEGDLPWSALESFTDAVVADPNVATELFAEYDKAWQAVDTPTYIDLYVPAIFTLAAPKLSDEQRREIGGFLVDRLIQAGREDAEVAEETLVKAAGSMGPVILPKVLDTLDSTPQDEEEAEAWAHCWSLTALAAKTDDAAIRNRTIQTCLRLLEQIDRGEREEFLGISAAWTLAYLKYADAIPLIERLSRKVAPIDGGADFHEAARFLQGQSAHVYSQMWEVPVKKWLASSWKWAKEWYAQQNAQASAGEEEGLDARDQDAVLSRMFEEAQRGLDEIPQFLPEQTPVTRPIPIVEHAPKVGRNDPCPCGSGRKYKKCHGAATRE